MCTPNDKDGPNARTMSLPDLALLALLIFATAVVYSSVGQAGATGYIALMALFGLAPEVMKPTALTLNILVAALSSYSMYRAKLLSWRAAVPLLAGSIPMAFIGGAIALPAPWYEALVGAILVGAGTKVFIQQCEDPEASRSRTVTIPIFGGIVSGAAVGFLSGLSGTGGGIFLAPLLLYLGWANARQAAGITAPFILANSISALSGDLVCLRSLPAELPYFAVAALLGALLGTQLGIRWFSVKRLQQLLGTVLLIAGGKFLLP